MPSYNERLTANNAKIDEITALANTLPDADEINEKIDAQDTIIENLKSALDDKAGKGGAKLNVFTQLTEPTTKKGIWLQTNKQMEHCVCDSDVYTGGNWASSSETAKSPNSTVYGDAVCDNTDIYIFGGNGGRTKTYKYNTLTDTYTQLTNIPYNFYSGCTVKVNNIVYLLGGNEDAKRNYKYDITNNTYTANGTLPIYIYNKYAAVVGTDIYMFSSNDAYKYDTINNSYTKLTNAPLSVNGTSVVSVGTDIYLFGSYNNPSKAYKYNTLTDTYIRLADTPYDFQSGDADVVGNIIHLFGGTDNTTKHYEYNISTDTYTQSVNIPYTFRNGISVACGDGIHLFGSDVGSTGDEHRKYIAQGKSYETDNTVVIQNGTTYVIELINTELIEENYQPLYGFADAWFYTDNDGLITNIPTYYGDGTQWVNIKN